MGPAAYMNGREVFRFATRVMGRAAKEAVPETPPLEPIPAEWVAEV